MPGSDGRPLPERDLLHVLEHTSGVWGELRGARLFVTGGTGFFGRWMLESLLRANAEMGLGASVTLLTRDPRAFAAAAPHIAARSEITLHEGDVQTFDDPPVASTHILHMATETALGGSAAASFVTAVRGTERVLRLAAAQGTRGLLLTSSGAVYGPQPTDMDRLPEDYAGAARSEDPSTGYAQGKRAAEFMCSVAAAETGLAVKIARCFAFVGPMLPLEGNFAVGNFIRDALYGDHIEVKGDGTARRSYLYAADLAIWLWRIMVEGAPARPYNVGSEDDLSIAELARVVARVLRPESPVRVAAVAKPGVPSARYVPSTARAAGELGLRPHVHLEDALLRTAQWHRQAGGGAR